MGLTVTQLQRAQFLRSSMMFDALFGHYKSFKEAKKEYASLAVQDFQKVMSLPKPSASAPLITKYGLNMLYVAIRDFFRIKTPDEKLLKKMGYEEYKKQKLSQMA